MNHAINNAEYEKVIADRQKEVFKANSLIQEAKFSLTALEQRAILYVITKVKPTDTSATEYEFDINHFYNIIGWKNESYTEFKKMLKGLADKSWYASIDDTGTECLLRWFTDVRLNKKSNKVILRFHDNLMPFITHLAENNVYYTKYQLQYVLPMGCRYSPRLYELLKSYEFNNWEWFFDIDALKRLLDCENYKNFSDFKRFALEPAVAEVNKFSDLRIAYDLERKGRKITRVIFYFKKKTKERLLETEDTIRDELDGQLDIFGIEKRVNESDTVRRRFLRGEE